MRRGCRKLDALESGEGHAAEGWVQEQRHPDMQVEHWPRREDGAPPRRVQIRAASGEPSECEDDGGDEEREEQRRAQPCVEVEAKREGTLQGLEHVANPHLRRLCDDGVPERVRQCGGDEAGAPTWIPRIFDRLSARKKASNTGGHTTCEAALGMCTLRVRTETRAVRWGRRSRQLGTSSTHDARHVV